MAGTPGVNDGVDRLDAVILHHVVNTLGWPDLRPSNARRSDR
jgi:ATP-dependent Lhr-like helicase